jgi:hypothetical protein
MDMTKTSNPKTFFTVYFDSRDYTYHVWMPRETEVSWDEIATTLGLGCVVSSFRSLLGGSVPVDRLRHALFLADTTLLQMHT